MDKLIVIIPVVIAVAAVVSPIFVALINNHHQAKMRERELKHEYEMKKLELEESNKKRNMEIHYAEKRDAYNKFLIAAGENSPDWGISVKEFSKITATASSAILFSSEKNQAKINQFIAVAKSTSNGSKEDNESYWLTLFYLASSLNQELQLVYKEDCT